MRSIFASHGSPTILVEDVAWKGVLSRLGKEIKTSIDPETVVVVSPHFVSWDGVHLVEIQEKLECIQDYYGFPAELYQYCYSAQNDVKLAKDIVRRAKSEGVPVREDESWGLDHGAWIPLMYMFPEGVKAVAISITTGPISEHLALGKAIALASAGRRVLLLATGSPTHRLDLMYFKTPPKKSKFDSILIEALERGDPSVLDLESRPEWNAAQPEGLLRPLYVALGASGLNGAKVIAHDVPWSGVSMLAVDLGG